MFQEDYSQWNQNVILSQVSKTFDRYSSISSMWHFTDYLHCSFFSNSQLKLYANCKILIIFVKEMS